MGDGLAFIDILIFALIAAFLIFRLRSVLGRRTGQEQQRPSPYTRREQQRPEVRSPDNVVALPDRARPMDEGSGGGLAGGLTQIRIADPTFDERTFVQGAQMAFGMIVEAFAAGDTASLRPLLSDDLYDSFSEAIRNRVNEGETLETRIERIVSADILEAEMEGRTAQVTVKFVSRQIIATRDEDGTVIDGDPETAQEITDIWKFARNTRSTDPNWVLVETRPSN
ncbi:MAG: Tim44 domain-containing protein [Rhodospirillaceae bacterium]|nr:Tim44 domain-containing protein [Rhodospirillaceae bacterium]